MTEKCQYCNNSSSIKYENEKYANICSCHLTIQLPENDVYPQELFVFVEKYF